MKRVLLNTALVLVSLAVGLGIAEVGLRVVGFDNPPFYQPDPITGVSLRPNTAGGFERKVGPMCPLIRMGCETEIGRSKSHPAPTE